ncbi:MAG: membrane protein insertase YidC [Candidatus Cloacimonetes bacterium]|nr:membrane protein insertase YidC [Candidatus Cloacimonadota bacterium]
MDKKTLLAIILIFGVYYFSSEFIWNKQEQFVKHPAENVQEKSTYSKTEEKTEERFQKIQNEIEEEEEIEENEIENNIILENRNVKIVFTNRGGNIRQVYLKNIMKSQENKIPVELLLSENGLFNIQLFTDSEEIDLGKHNLEYNLYGNELEFYLEKDGKKIVQKKYKLKDDYNLSMDLIVKELGKIDSYNLGMDSGICFDEKDDKRFKNYIKTVFQKDNKVDKINLKKIVNETRELRGKFDWTVVKSKYFMIAAIPKDRVELNKISAYADENSLKQNLTIEVSRTQFDHKFDFYLGPVNYDKLKEYNIGIENAFDFGILPSITRPISKLVLGLLKFLYSLFPNFGISIIIMSIMLKVVFYPLTHKGTRSTKKMQEIQPKVKALQKKYKNNPQKSQQEVMALYKEHGVSPLGGCLPLLIQMPVFFALYPVLQSSIALRHAKFILWIKDLSVPDPYSILPIVMGITMFLQQKLMAPKPTVDMDEKQLAQMKSQKFMMYGMPIFLVFIFRSLPAGLVLYWFSYNILSICEQLLIKKKEKNQINEK